MFPWQPEQSTICSFCYRVEAPGKKLCRCRTLLEVVLFFMFCISTAVAMALGIVMATMSESSWQETIMSTDAAGSGTLCYVLYLHFCCCGTRHGNQNNLYHLLYFVLEWKLLARNYNVDRRRWKWFSLLCLVSPLLLLWYSLLPWQPEQSIPSVIITPAFSKVRYRGSTFRPSVHNLRRV